MNTALPQRGWGIAGALLALYALLAVPAIQREAAVADEHPHILSGWLFWDSGRFSGGLDNPPLGQLLVAAPLRLLHVDYQFPADTHLWLARLPVLLLLLALAALVARWGSEIGGVPVACAALLALCLEPNLLAHGHLATLDVPLTFFWWAALWRWRAVLAAQSAEKQGIASPALVFFATAVALAAGTKFTGLLLLPACWVTSLVVLRGRRAWLQSTATIVGALLLLVLATHVFYAFGNVRHGLPEHWGVAIAGKITHREEGHFAYLAGRRSLTGFPEYYLATLLFKLPLPLLAFAVFGGVSGWRRLSRLDRACLVVPALFLLLVVSLVRVNIGIRHVLPVLPAIVLLAGLGIAQAWQRGRWARGAVVTAMLAWAAGFGLAAPQYLAYFNVLGGGPAGGHRFLLDSNLAWGQDDDRLEQFLARADRAGETWEVNPSPKTARTGKFAVDVNTLHQLLRADPTPYIWLRPLRPRGHAGFSWRLYDLSLEDFAARARQRPTDAEAQIAWAEALQFNGETSRAGAVYDSAANATAGAARVFHSAAFAALERGDFAAADAWIRRGLDRHPTDRVLAASMQRLRLERRFVGTGPTASGRDALELGLWWAERGEIDKALPWLERAASARPRDAESQRALAVGLAQLGKFEAAARTLEPVAARAGLGADLAALRRLARTSAGLWQSEFGDSAPAPEFDPAAGMEFAAAMFRVRRYDPAAAALVEILRRDPADGAALALLCEMQVRSKLLIVPERLNPRSITSEDVNRGEPGR